MIRTGADGRGPIKPRLHRILAPGTDATADTIDLRAALTGPEVVVFSLNSSRYGQLAAQVGALAVQDLVTVSGVRLDQPAAGRAVKPAMIG